MIVHLRNPWMSFLKPTNSGLIGLSKEQLLRKRDCEKHFDKHQFDEEGERRILIHTYLVFTDLEIAHGVPLSSNESDRNALSDHNYYKENSSGDVNATNDNMFVIGSPGGDFHGHPLCLETYTSSSTENNVYSYIRHREYNLLKNNLVYPSSKHLMYIYQIYIKMQVNYIHNYLNKNAYQKRIKVNLRKSLEN